MSVLLPEPFLPSGWFWERYSPKALAALHVQASQKAAKEKKKEMNIKGQGKKEQFTINILLFSCSSLSLSFGDTNLNML